MKVTIGILSAVIVGLLVVIVVGVIGASRAHDRWAADCASRGGHVSTSVSTGTGVGVGVGAGGKVGPVVTTTTQSTSYCLSADGRILSIEGAS